MLVRAADLTDCHLNPKGHGGEHMGCLGVSSLCPLVEPLKFGEASAACVVIPSQALSDQGRCRDCTGGP